MAGEGVYITGLREITRGLERAGVDVEELKDVMGRIAAKATDVMQPFIPTGKTKQLRASARGNRAKGKAVVTVGRGKTRAYAGVIAYGWAKRNIKPARFVQRTDDVMERIAPQMLEAGWGEIAERHGLT